MHKMQGTGKQTHSFSENIHIPATKEGKLATQLEYKNLSCFIT